MLRLWLFLLLLLPCLSGAALSGALSGAESPAVPAAEELVVAVKLAPPFVVADGRGGYRGIGIDLWEAIAEDLGLAFSYREMGLQELLNAVASGEAAVGVGAVTATLEREEKLDFTHPFYTTGFGLVTTATQSAWWQVLRQFFSLGFLKVLTALLLLLTVIGVVVWLAERRRNAEQFGGPALHGVGNGLWWSAVTMTTVGYGDKAPVTLTGRVLALGWMFASIIIISGFTGAIASSLTVGGLNAQIGGIADLDGRRVGVVAGTTGAGFVGERGLREQVFDDVQSALQGLRQGEVTAVLHDLPILRYEVGDDDQLRVLPQTYGRQDYGLALPPASPRREVMNRAVLRILESSRWQAIQQKYLPAVQD